MTNDPSAAAPEAPSPAAPSTEPVQPTPAPTLTLSEQVEQLEGDGLSAAIALLSPDRPKGKTEGVDGGAAPAEEAAPSTANPDPAASPADDAPPVNPDDARPGRIRLDRIADERTRKILEFQSRNHDATIEDAIEYVDGKARAGASGQRATPQSAPTLATYEARVADLNRQIKEASDTNRDGYDEGRLAKLREDLIEARLDVRFAQRDAASQATTVQAQRATAREQSVARALEMCPEINDPNSPQGKEFTRLHEEFQRRGSSILNDDDCAETIAARVMYTTGYTRQPAAPAPAAPAAPATPAPVARTPIPVVRAPVPAPVGAPGSAKLSQPPAISAERLLQAVDEMDGDQTSDIIAMLTTKADSQPKKFSLE